MFKGVIYKRVIAAIKVKINEAEEKYQEGISKLDEKYQKDLLALDAKLSSDKSTLEDSFVNDILKKII